MRAPLALALLLLPTLAAADPGAAQTRAERAIARKEARTIELLQRSTTREGVEAEATARWLERFGDTDVRAEQRIAPWYAEVRPIATPILALPAGPSPRPRLAVPAVERPPEPATAPIAE